MHRKWFVSRTNPEYIRYISNTASVSPALAQVLINRGIKTPQGINDFLNPDISGLSDPFDMHGIKIAVERIQHAIAGNERVLVHGDYDADGLTATAIMVQALRAHGMDVHYFIPNRITHGYGFNPFSVKIAKKLGAALIITVDCGITSFDAVTGAKNEGIDVIITDHHEPIKTGISGQGLGVSEKIDTNPQSPDPAYMLPDAVTVINPKLSTLNSQLSTLSGAGVAFKVAQALDLSLATHYSSLLLDLAAIGTMADVVPLTGENRIIVKKGMQLIDKGQRQGIMAIKSAAGIDSRELRAELLSFTVIPRINAAGRISDATDVIRLLLSDIYEEVSDLSLWLGRLNSERQKIEEAVYQEALAKLTDSGQWAADSERPSVIVLSGGGWHQGVVGIVASRLAEEFSRPAFILSVEDGIAKGSARSVPSFDICKGLAECKGLLLAFGGHKQAAGLKLKTENIPIFEEAMRNIIKTSLAEDDFVPRLEIDADILLSEVNRVLIREIAMLEPLGYGNEEPLFASKGLEVVNPRIVGNNHLKMRLKQGTQSIDTIGFDMGNSSMPSVIDAVFTPAVNEWNGGSYLQLNLKAFRPSA